MKAKTLGKLKEQGYQVRSVKEELRTNLISKLRKKEPIFPGVIGYEDTVLKEFTTALLSQHDVLLLGLRGQGKTRLLRQLHTLLDDFIPVIAGSPVNDDPLAPISVYGKKLLKEKGDATPIDWLPKEKRFGEKLATPDVNMADLLGDIDPIKAVSQKLDYSHEEILHFGLLPRMNRGIFVINELPDLQPRIQVGLLGIMEEREFQVRGFPVRMPLDIFMGFTANPEDYTNRGNIITPLKDRIDSQIITHYPHTIEEAIQISDQEAWVNRQDSEGVSVEIPKVLREITEQIAFEAREAVDFIDPQSGVSSRLSITAVENLVSTAERRALLCEEFNTVGRVVDLNGVLPALTGKLELVYEGEQEGPINIAKVIVGKAIKKVFARYFEDPYITSKSNEKDAEESPVPNPYHKVLEWFGQNNTLVLNDSMSEEAYQQALLSIPHFGEALEQAWKGDYDISNDETFLYMELLLDGLYQHSRLSKDTRVDGQTYQDVMSELLDS